MFDLFLINFGYVCGSYKTLEMIARMTKSDKDEFVQTFVEKWPHLAEEIAFSINAYLQDKNVENNT